MAALAAALLGLSTAVALLIVVGLARRQRRLLRALARATARLGGPVPAPEEGLDAQVRALDDQIDAVTGAPSEQVSSERLVRALDAIPQGVVICDERGQVVFENEVGARYARARHGDALVSAAVTELLADASAGPATSRTVELYGPPRRTLVVDAYPLSDGEGTGRRGALAVINDVSERRRIDQVRRDFVANISHELKTPVGALALLAEALIAADEEDRERLARRMLTEAHRVGNTIDDLLSLSRIEADQGAEWEPVAVDAVIHEAASRARSAAEQRGIRIETPTTPPIAVVGDLRQLVSAVFNLLDNAVKYSDPGSAVVVGARQSGNWVELVVSDHGPGIPARDLERIFERFYRVDRARSRETGGTGLGLAIVRHVANNHGGVVSVDSREGEGSTFTLRLPGRPADRHRPSDRVDGAEPQIERSGV